MKNLIAVSRNSRKIFIILCSSNTKSWKEATAWNSTKFRIFFFYQCSKFPSIFFVNFTFHQIPFLLLPLLVLVMAASTEGRFLEKRQAQSGDRFFLFGQVMSSLGESEASQPSRVQQLNISSDPT